MSCPSDALALRFSSMAEVLVQLNYINYITKLIPIANSCYNKNIHKVDHGIIKFDMQNVSKKTAIVIGNCQARAVSNLMGQLRKSLQLVEPIILHLANENDANIHRSKIDQVDYIFAQLTSKSFMPSHLETQTL